MKRAIIIAVAMLALGISASAYELELRQAIRIDGISIEAVDVKSSQFDEPTEMWVIEVDAVVTIPAGMETGPDSDSTLTVDVLVNIPTITVSIPEVLAINEVTMEDYYSASQRDYVREAAITKFYAGLPNGVTVEQ